MLHHASMNTTESENEFIRLKGVAIAACAWNGYKVDALGLTPKKWAL